MWCLNCQRENKSTDRFCIYCGAPLSVQDVSSQIKVPAAQDTTQPQSPRHSERNWEAIASLVLIVLAIITVLVSFGSFWFRDILNSFRIYLAHQVIQYNLLFLLLSDLAVWL